MKSRCSGDDGYVVSHGEFRAQKHAKIADRPGKTDGINTDFQFQGVCRQLGKTDSTAEPDQSWIRKKTLPVR